MLRLSSQFLLGVLILFYQPFAQTSPHILNFATFLNEYQDKSTAIIEAKQGFSIAQQTKDANSDFWRSRIEASPEMSFLSRQYDGSSGQPDIGNRSQNINGTFTQLTPTGTQFELKGQKYIEVQNPLFSSLDRSYSAKITQDLFNNAFGKTQRAIAKRAEIDLEVAGLKYLESVINSCQEAYKLYIETFTQQEITKVYDNMLKDAKIANANSQRLYQDRLITKIDKLSSETDLMTTQIQAEQSLQKLIANKRQIAAFLPENQNIGFELIMPSEFIENSTFDPNKQTLKVLIAEQKLKSQEIDIERSRSNRWTDLELGLEAGQRIGRFGFTGTLVGYTEEYLLTSLKVGIDVINKTEDADLRNSIRQKNLLAVQRETLHFTQNNLIASLYDNHKLLLLQQKSSRLQVKLLDEKMKIAFEQTKMAKLEFENYLLHRNAFLNQKINDLNLQKDLWLNFFAIQKEYAHEKPAFCEAKI